MEVPRPVSKAPASIAPATVLSGGRDSSQETRQDSESRGVRDGASREVPEKPGRETPQRGQCPQQAWKRICSHQPLCPTELCDQGQGWSWTLAFDSIGHPALCFLVSEPRCSHL